MIILNHNELNIKPEESELAYILRIGLLKQQGIIDMTWRELADVFNKNLREDNPWTESAYRKKFENYQHYRDEFADCSADAEEMTELRRELEKERVKLRDERTAYNKLIRDEARKESYKEQFLRSIEEAAGKHPLDYDKSAHHDIVRGNTTIVAPLTDIHLGITIHNSWNDYDEDILRQMLLYYIDNISDIAIRHGSEDIIVLASELVSGLIHPTLRIQNNQDLMDQFINAVDYVCDFLSILSTKFNSVKFFVAPGNHGRINPKKEDGLAHENMDVLVVPFVKARMKEYPNVHVYNNEVDSGIVTTDVNGYKLVFVHGDKDEMSNVTRNMTKLLGYVPDIILTGHKHYNSYTTDGTTKVVQSGSFVGADEYAVNKRLVGKQEQAVLVVSNNGLDCIYDVRF